jgi:hypothetical protein
MPSVKTYRLQKLKTTLEVLEDMEDLHPNLAFCLIPAIAVIEKEIEVLEK